MPLDTYNKKRDFSKTKEPRGEGPLAADAQARGAAGPLRYVIQEHHARSLHYDFRLEMDGVLKSWAVPKGPPEDFGIRRLAIQTEDHPLSYIDFQGTIPAGNYGAGSVSVWDTGIYENASKRGLDEGLRRGKLEVILHGDRLDAQYDLIRIDEQKNEWLMIKAHGAAGRNAEQDARENAPGKPAEMPTPESISPMLAVTLEEPFSDPDWQFELKWDGYRALLFVRDAHQQLISRNHLALDRSFQELAGLADYLDCADAVVDGEIVALTPEGRPRFQSLQNRLHVYGRQPRKRSLSADEAADKIVYMAFDLLYCDGRDLTRQTLAQRRRKLAGIIRPGGSIRFSDHVDGDGIALFEQAREAGMEGIMAKRSASMYIQARSSDWAKIKLRSTRDVVIAGYTESESAGRPFASLLMGEYDENGKLIPIGHVGTGFNAASLRSIHAELAPLEVKDSPFAVEARLNGKAHWVLPKLVAEVKYAEVTHDGSLRQPAFVRLRPDKDAAECRRGMPAAPKPRRREDRSERGGLMASSGSEIKKGYAAELPGELAEALNPESKMANATVDVRGRSIKLTHLDKVYWPKTGATKRDLLRYTAVVADAMLAHLAQRPLVIQRYPDGVEGESFFQHDAGPHPPDFLSTFAIEEKSGLVRYPLCDEPADLLYLANLGAIPIHTWNVRTDASQSPDRIVFDIDPPETGSAEDGWRAAIAVAQCVKEVLDEIGMLSYPKTSGASGLHVTVPLLPEFTSDEVVAFSQLIGHIVRSRLPDLVAMERRVDKRGKGKVYFDCLQNGVGKTVVAPYSVRPRPTPTVSTPLAWEEVSDGLQPETFTIDTLPERLRSRGDLMAGALQSRNAASIDSALKLVAAKYGDPDEIEKAGH